MTGAGPGGGPHVKVFDGVTHIESFGFFAFDPTFTGGTRIAVGDIDGDSAAEIAVAGGIGGSAEVRLFSGNSGTLISNVQVDDSQVRTGATIAVGDLTGDGKADLIVGTGGGVSRVTAFDLANGNQPILSIAPYAPGFDGPVWVATGDMTGDGVADIITGAGLGGGPHVRIFDGKSHDDAGSWFAYELGFRGGAFVATADLDADGQMEVVTGAGPGGGPHVKRFNRYGIEENGGFFAYGNASTSSDGSDSSGGDSGGGPIIPPLPPTTRPPRPQDNEIISDDFGGWEAGDTYKLLVINDFDGSPATQESGISMLNASEYYNSSGEVKYDYSSVSGVESYTLGLRKRNFNISNGSDTNTWIIHYTDRPTETRAAQDVNGYFNLEFSTGEIAAVAQVILRKSYSIQERNYEYTATRDHEFNFLQYAIEGFGNTAKSVAIGAEFPLNFDFEYSTPLKGYRIQIGRQEDGLVWHDLHEERLDSAQFSHYSTGFTPRLPGRYYLRILAETAEGSGKTIFSRPISFRSVFPNAIEIVSNSDIRAAFDTLMQSTIASAQTTGVVNERAILVQFDTINSTYVFSEGVADDSSPYIEDVPPEVKFVSYFKEDTKSGDTPFDGGRFMIAQIHTHTPAEYRKVKDPALDAVFGAKSRIVGPSETDIAVAAKSFVPSFVYDYLPPDTTLRIPVGYPSGKPTIITLIPESLSRREYTGLVIGGPLDI